MASSIFPNINEEDIYPTNSTSKITTRNPNPGICRILPALSSINEGNMLWTILGKIPSTKLKAAAIAQIVMAIGAITSNP